MLSSTCSGRSEQNQSSCYLCLLRVWFLYAIWNQETISQTVKDCCPLYLFIYNFCNQTRGDKRYDKDVFSIIIRKNSTNVKDGGFSSCNIIRSYFAFQWCPLVHMWGPLLSLLKELIDIKLDKSSSIYNTNQGCLKTIQKQPINFVKQAL